MKNLWAAIIVLSLLIVVGVGVIIVLQARKQPTITANLNNQPNNGDNVITPTDDSTNKQPSIIDSLNQTLSDISRGVSDLINPPAPPAQTPPAAPVPPAANNNTNIDNTNTDNTDETSVPPNTPEAPASQTVTPPPEALNPPPPPTGNTVTVLITNFQFGTPVVTINAGDTVIWKNNDKKAQSVASLTSAFNSGTIAVGATYSHRFEDKGTFEYHCTFVPSMIGRVIVN